jgi:hypothetical protein
MKTFKNVLNLDEMTPDELDKRNFYRGFPCPHGHVIRDKDEHWCYHCVKKIKSNICGFDISYLDALYRNKYQHFFNTVQINSFKEHWHWTSSKKRLIFPSYRSFNSSRQSDNISIHKLMYHLAWGDVGSLSVARICDDKHCINPLHLASVWNRFAYPKEVHPMEFVIKPEKLLQSFYVPKELILESQYKNTIQHPLEVSEDLPAYHEDE